MALAQLVLHFVSQPRWRWSWSGWCDRAVGGRLRVGLRRRMETLWSFWDAALVLDPDAPDEAGPRFGGRGDRRALHRGRPGGRGGVDPAGDVDERGVRRAVDGSGGIGPAAPTCVSRTDDYWARLRAELFGRLVSPEGLFTLDALAVRRGLVPA